MPRISIVKKSKVMRSHRVVQLEGMFDFSSTEENVEKWNVDIPFEEKDWSIGLIVGPSGSGKTIIAREIFGSYYVDKQRWSKNKSIVDAFSSDFSIKEISLILSQVGFSSPPSWLKSYNILSTGEKFRVSMARAILESDEMCVIDEFTSTVDRTVAKIGSFAVSKFVRSTKKKFVAVSCHYDVIEWLQPDWIYEPHIDKFCWRLLQQRPTIEICIRRVKRNYWKLFCKYHYLSSVLSSQSQCYVGSVENVPVVFVAMCVFSHWKNSCWKNSCWRIHRVVCLPDFQGVGIGSKVMEFVASLYRGLKGRGVFLVTSHPGFIRYCAKSESWKMTRKPGRSNKIGRTSTRCTFKNTVATNRLTASFEFVGNRNTKESQLFEL